MTKNEEPKSLSDDDLAAVSGGAGPAAGGPPGSGQDDFMNALLAMQADRLAALDGAIADQKGVMQQNAAESSLMTGAAEMLRKGFEGGPAEFEVDTVIEGPLTSFTTQERSVLGTLHQAVNALDLDPAKAEGMLRDGRIDKAEGTEIIGLAEAKIQQMQDQALIDTKRLEKLEDSREELSTLVERMAKPMGDPKIPR